MEALKMLKPSKRKRQKRRDKRMDEELIECYRRGSSAPSKGKGYKKRRVGNDFEYAAKHEGIKVMSGGYKELTDNLNPLKRYLDSKVGKHWDKVHSDLCRKMDKHTVSGLHVFQHLFDFVETNVEIRGSKIYALGRFGGEREIKSYSYWPQFYVHPKSGVLMKVKKQKRKKC